MHELICEIEKGKLTKNKCAKNTYQMIIQIFQIKGRMHIINMIGTYHSTRCIFIKCGSAKKFPNQRQTQNITRYEFAYLLICVSKQKPYNSAFNFTYACKGQQSSFLEFRRQKFSKKKSVTKHGLSETMMNDVGCRLFFFRTLLTIHI